MIKNKELIEKLVTQACKERDHALEYREKRHAKWEKTDELYFLRKRPSLVSRANIHFPILNGAIETLLSQTRIMPGITFEATTIADRPKAEDAGALLKQDSVKWNSTDLYGKKEAYLYGRCNEKKYSSRVNGKFQDHRELVQCIDFLIDPMCGGLDPISFARFLGQDNLIRTKFELSDKTIYDQEAVEEIVGPIHSDNRADDKYNSHARKKYSQSLDSFAYVSDDAVNLTEWYTTYEGTRYYILFSPYAKKAIRVEKLKDMFSNDEWPFSSWAAFVVKDEFWSPAPAELFHDLNYVQNVLVSQLLDNSAFRNYGMTAYDKTKIPNPNQLDPRPQGRIAVNGNPSDALLPIQFPSLGENITLLTYLSSRYDTDTGVTQQSKGVPYSKRMSAREFDGLLQQIQERVLVYNEQYTEHYRRLGKLYLDGLKDNLTEKRRVEVLGASGIRNNFISKDSLDFQSDVNILVSLEELGDIKKQNEDKLVYIKENRENPRVSQKMLDQIEAKIIGFSKEEIDQILNPALEGSWLVVSEAHQENERLLSKKVEPNRAANIAHIQAHLDFLRNTSDLKDDQVRRIQNHAEAEIPIATENASLEISKILNAQVPRDMQNTIDQAVTPPQQQAPQPQGPMTPMPPM